MPLVLSRRHCRFAVLAGAALALTLAGVPVASAFTIQDATNAGQDQSFLYPGKPLTADDGQSSKFKQENGMTTFKEGPTTLQFGHRESFDQRYNPDNMFDPLGHPPGVR